MGLWVLGNQALTGLLDTVGVTILAFSMSTTKVGLLAFAMRALRTTVDFIAPFDSVASRHMLMQRGVTGNKVTFGDFAKYMTSPLSGYLLLVSLLQGGIYLVFAQLTRLFLPKFLDALPILNILLLTGMLYGVSAYSYFYMNATDQLERRLALLISVLSLNIGIALFLLRQGLGMYSVAWAALISYVLFSAASLGLTIRQTSKRSGTALSVLTRVFSSMGLLTLAAIYLDSCQIVGYSQETGSISRIAFSLFDLAPKLVIYAIVCLTLFLTLFRDHALWAEVKWAVRFLVSALPGRRLTST